MATPISFSVQQTTAAQNYLDVSGLSLPDTNYGVYPTVTELLGNWYITNKTSSGFRINFQNFSVGGTDVFINIYWDDTSL